MWGVLWCACVSPSTWYISRWTNSSQPEAWAKGLQGYDLDHPTHAMENGLPEESWYCPQAPQSKGPRVTHMCLCSLSGSRACTGSARVFIICYHPKFRFSSDNGRKHELCDRCNIGQVLSKNNHGHENVPMSIVNMDWWTHGIFHILL